MKLSKSFQADRDFLHVSFLMWQKLSCYTADCTNLSFDDTHTQNITVQGSSIPSKPFSVKHAFFFAGARAHDKHREAVS